ncbi:MAG TPA: hypothetical protein VK433_09805, partial [Stellaceae bacterium]|nr:hypothetical protein [Stellaceae bacterium]
LGASDFMLKGAPMTTSTIHPAFPRLSRNSTSVSFSPRDRGAPWKLYAALGLFLAGVVLKAFAAISLG